MLLQERRFNSCRRRRRAPAALCRPLPSLPQLLGRQLQPLQQHGAHLLPDTLVGCRRRISCRLGRHGCCKGPAAATGAAKAGGAAHRAGTARRSRLRPGLGAPPRAYGNRCQLLPPLAIFGLASSGRTRSSMQAGIHSLCRGACHLTALPLQCLALRCPSGGFGCGRFHIACLLDCRLFWQLHRRLVFVWRARRLRKRLWLPLGSRTRLTCELALRLCGRCNCKCWPPAVLFGTLFR